MTLKPTSTSPQVQDEAKTRVLSLVPALGKSPSLKQGGAFQLRQNKQACIQRRRHTPDTHLRMQFQLVLESITEQLWNTGVP